MCSRWSVCAGPSDRKMCGNTYTQPCGLGWYVITPSALRTRQSAPSPSPFRPCGLGCYVPALTVRKTRGTAVLGGVSTPRPVQRLQNFAALSPAGGGGREADGGGLFGPGVPVHTVHTVHHAPGEAMPQARVLLSPPSTAPDRARQCGAGIHPRPRETRGHPCQRGTQDPEAGHDISGRLPGDMARTTILNSGGAMVCRPYGT